MPYPYWLLLLLLLLILLLLLLLLLVVAMFHESIKKIQTSLSEKTFLRDLQTQKCRLACNKIILLLE